MSPWPVIKIIGIPTSANSRWSSRPLNPGRRTSSTRHAGASGRVNGKKSSAEAKIWARIPIDRNRRDNASRIEASSSTAKTIGSSGFTLYLPFQSAVRSRRYYSIHCWQQPRVAPPQLNGNNHVKVSFTVTNTGDLAGAEIAELYVGQQNPPIVRPIKELKGFQKVFLQPAASQKVTIELDQRSVTYFNTAIHQGDGL